MKRRNVIRGNTIPLPVQPRILIVLDNCMPDLAIQLVRLSLVEEEQANAHKRDLPVVVVPLRQIIDPATKDLNLADTLTKWRKGYDRQIIFMTTDKHFWLNNVPNQLSATFTTPEHKAHKRLVVSFAKNGIHLITIKQCPDKNDADQLRTYEAAVLRAAEEMAQDMLNKPYAYDFLAGKLKDCPPQDWFVKPFQQTHHKRRNLTTALHTKYHNVSEQIGFPYLGNCINMLIGRCTAKDVYTCRFDVIRGRVSLQTNVHKIDADAKGFPYPPELMAAVI